MSESQTATIRTSQFQINFVPKPRVLKLMVITVVERVVVMLLLFRRTNVDVWLTKVKRRPVARAGSKFLHCRLYWCLHGNVLI